MTDAQLILLLSVGVALAVVLLIWAVIDIGSNGLLKYRQAFTEKAHVGLREMFLFLDPRHLFLLHISIVALAGLIGWAISSSVIFGAVCAVIAAILPRVILKYMRTRRLEAMESQLPDALMTMAGGLRAGASLTQALAQMVREGRPPITQEFELLLREQRLGVPLDTCLEGLNSRIPLQSMTLAISAMRIAQETGGGLAEALERASETLRTKLAMEGKIRALTAQGKLQAIVVGLLPLVLMYALNHMEPEAMHLMYTTPVGWATLAVIAVLEFFGILIIRKIVAIDV